MIDLEFAGISVIAARHAEIAHDELREEGEIETDVGDERGELTHFFRIHASGDFWPPIMQSAHESGDHSPDHNVMEMGDDEIGVGKVNVHGEGSQEQTGQASDDKQTDETQGIKHGGLEGDRAAVEGSGPVENFYAGGDGNQEAEEREDETGIDGLAGDKHVVAPDEETKDGDGHAGIGNEVVAEDFFA